MIFSMIDPGTSINSSFKCLAVLSVWLANLPWSLRVIGSGLRHVEELCGVIGRTSSHVMTQAISLAGYVATLLVPPSRRSFRHPIG